MAGLRAFCEDIHSAVTEANHDWSDVTVTTALDRADDAYLTKIHGADHHLVDRTKLVTCIQNWRHRLRDEYTRLYGKDDDGLAEYLATTNLLPAEQTAFIAMTQSRRLKSIKSAPYTDIPDACWGGVPWRALGCAPDISRERTSLRQAQRREAYPLVFDPLGLHAKIVEVTSWLLTTLENPLIADFENVQIRRFLARLISLSLYGLGCARFTDLVPGAACKIGGGRAESMGQVYELHAGCIRYFHVSKNQCERARWRVCLFDETLSARITTFLRSRFDDITALTMSQPNWIQRVLQTRRGSYCAWEGLHPERYALVPTTFSMTPYSFKHLGLSLLPNLYHITSVHALRIDILACELGHIDWNRNSVANYGIFDVCVEQQHTLPSKAVQISESGLYICDRPIVPHAEIIVGKKKRRHNAADTG